MEKIETLPKNFCPIKNNIIEELAKTHLSDYEWRTIMAIIRKTYGWKTKEGKRKTEDYISLSQLSEATGILIPHIARSIKLLISRLIITKGGKKLGINKDTNSWVKLPKGVTTHHSKKLPKGVIKVTKGGNKKLPKGVDTKEIYKETYTKEITNTHVLVSINKMIELFKPINPSYERLFANKTERGALQRMVDKWGEEKVTRAIMSLPQIIVMPYAPKITTPYQLETNMGKLIAFMKQENIKINKYQVKTI